ncbi:MAG: MFS transporter [Pseudomonadota bacterium]
MSSDYSDKMTVLERRSTLSLGAVYAVRMLGLFMILPVFALYAEDFEKVTPLLIGLAIGAYGLTQALFQIPLGMLSDRIGRKPVIVGGLMVFAAGSAVAALADTLTGVILGRALQGSGAIAAAVMALAADLTREEHRTKVMAVIGLSIGVAFSVALVAGPVLNHWIGVPGIFWLTAVLALVAIVIVLRFVPQPVSRRLQRDTRVVGSAIRRIISDPELLRLDLGIFVLHMVLTANFIVIPVLLRDQAGLLPQHHWMLYFPVLLGSFLLMLPFIIVAEKRRKLKPVFLGAIALLAMVEFFLFRSEQGLYAMATGLLLFFTAFNLLEASLPSLVTKLTAPDVKGTSMGVFSSSQFLGAFAGGGLGGVVLQTWGPQAVFTGSGMVILIWLLIGASMKNPRYLSSYLLNVGQLSSEHAKTMVHELSRVEGVAEAVVIPEDGVAYLKVDRKILDENRLREISISPA